MSDFDYMRVVLQHKDLQTVTTELPVSRVSRVWHKITRKPLPTITQEIPYVHTITVDDSHDSDTFSRLMTHAEAYGYEIVSVQVTDLYGTDELVGEWRGSPTALQLSALFDGIVNDEYRYDAYVAYTLENGWDSDMDTSRMDDIFQGTYDSPADYAESFVNDCYEMNVPDFVDIDWEGTAENIGQDVTYARHNGSTFVFWNH